MLADKYHDPNTFERELRLAWTKAQVEMSHLNIDAEEAHLFQRLAARIVYSDPSLRPRPHVLALNTKAQSSLWAYGISGDLQKAKETFQYGVNKDPTYPIFYYNLACTYAELGDAREAGNYLKKAFEYKANVLPGENIPDPRKDDSFKKLMKNKEFQELAETLARLR